MTTRVQVPGGASPQSDTLVSSSVLTRSPLTSDEFEVDQLEGRSPTPSDFSTSAFQENFAGVPVNSGSIAQLSPKPAIENATRFGQQAVHIVGGSSPHAPPSRYSTLMSQTVHTLGRRGSALGQLQRGYDNQYVGRVIQAKLTVGQPGDIYEQEADRVADQIMRMPEDRASSGVTVSEQIQPLRIQRLCTACEEEEDRIHRKESGGAAPFVTPAVKSRLDATRGGGQPLPESVRAQMEPQFGVDFGQVRVHAGSKAAELNRDLKAQAFTQQRDIYFGEGRYEPASDKGIRLLAHELTHVVQQDLHKNFSTIQREEFGEQITFDALRDPPPRARVFGPYSNSAIAEELYGNPNVPIVRTPEDHTIIQISYDLLLPRWKSYFPASTQESALLQTALPLEDADIFILQVDDQGNPTTGFEATQFGTEKTFLESGLTGLRPGITTGGAQSLGYILAPPIRSRVDPFLPLINRAGGISSPLGRQGDHFLLERYAGRGSQLLDELVPRYRGREGPALRTLEYNYLRSSNVPLSFADPNLAQWFTPPGHPYYGHGLSTRDLDAIPDLLARVKSGGFSSLSAAEQRILQSAVRAHAEFGQVPGSPFISATRQSGLSGMQGQGTNPTFLRERQYIVRVRVPESAVADVNALVPRPQGHHLAHEMEMLVATDARGNVQSVRPNPTSALGRAAPWIKVGGRVVSVAGLAYSGHSIRSATPEERPRVIGEEVGGHTGGFAGAGLGAAACITFGIASGGVGLLVCGLGGALIGGGVGTAVGGRIGASSTRPRTHRSVWDNPNKRCCFPGQVLVTTSSGTQRIDQVNPGDRVMSLNSDNGQLEEREVIGLEVHQGEFLLLEIDTYKGSIIVTTRHFFGKTSGDWISSEKIRPNCKLVGLDGETDVLYTSKQEQWYGTVYNLKVDGGNYFVGTNPVLVRDH